MWLSYFMFMHPPEFPLPFNKSYKEHRLDPANSLGLRWSASDNPAHSIASQRHQTPVSRYFIVNKISVLSTAALFRKEDRIKRRELKKGRTDETRTEEHHHWRLQTFCESQSKSTKEIRYTCKLYNGRSNLHTCIVLWGRMWWIATMNERSVSRQWIKFKRISFCSR